MSKSKSKSTRGRRSLLARILRSVGLGGSRRREPARPELDVVSQLLAAARNPGAAALGAAIGGIVPWFAREIAHGELPEAYASGPRWLVGAELVVVLGCALFSVLTVYKFGRAAFPGDARKAAGFCVALEGVMLVTHGRVSVVALVALVAINAIVNGCAIALSREATQRRQAADVRRQATAAETRARRRAQADAGASTGAPGRRTSAPAASAPASSRAPVATPATARARVGAPGVGASPVAMATIAWLPRRRHADAVDAEIADYS